MVKGRLRARELPQPLVDLVGRHGENPCHVGEIGGAEVLGAGRHAQRAGQAAAERAA